MSSASPPTLPGRMTLLDKLSLSWLVPVFGRILNQETRAQMAMHGDMLTDAPTLQYVTGSPTLRLAASLALRPCTGARSSPSPTSSPCGGPSTRASSLPCPGRSSLARPSKPTVTLAGSPTLPSPCRCLRKRPAVIPSTCRLRFCTSLRPRTHLRRARRSCTPTEGAISTRYARRDISPLRCGARSHVAPGASSS